MNEVKNNENVEVLQSKKNKYYLKCKANEYSCPDCGKMINKFIIKIHNASKVHQLAVLKKLVETLQKK
jgi:predicted RNA-binding Zn-ribbon protein involved in translation (DUF1610 family)